MAWHWYESGWPARAVQTAKRPRRWPLVVSARPGDSSVAVADRKTTRRTAVPLVAFGALEPSRAAERSALYAAQRARQDGARRRRIVIDVLRPHAKLRFERGTPWRAQLNFELIAHALKEAARAREMAHQRSPETPQHLPRQRATAAGPPSLPRSNVSPRAPPRRRKVPRRSESGTRRRTRPAGDAARSPSTCRRRCAPRAATRAPRCAGLTGPRKRCGGARTARAACAT